MQYLEIAQWDKFQSYKKRSPSWIRDYVEQLDKPEYRALSATSRGTLQGLRLLRARSGRPLPYDTKYLAAQLGITTQATVASLKQLISLNFIELEEETVANRRNGEDPNATVSDKSVAKSATETEADTDTVSSLRSDTARQGAPPSQEKLSFEDLQSITPEDGDWKRVLFGEGYAWLQTLDKPPGRSLLGKWMKFAGDDAHAVFETIARAQKGQVASPVDWITRQLQPAKPQPGDWNYVVDLDAVDRRLAEQERVERRRQRNH